MTPVLRAMGAGCIIIGAGLLGERAAEKEQQDLATVEAFLVALAVLEAEIAYLTSDLAEAFTKTAQSSQKTAGLFVRAARGLERGEGARAAWLAACREWGAARRLPARHVEILERLGAAWGPWRAKDHVRHIRLTRQLLKDEQQVMRVRIGHTCRLWRYLGVSGGLLLALLLC